MDIEEKSDASHKWVWDLKIGDKVWVAIEESIAQSERYYIEFIEQSGPSEYIGVDEIFVPYEMEVVNNWSLKNGAEESHIVAFEFTMKTPEEDAESLVLHMNRAGLTSDERNDIMYSEKSFKEVGKALREEQTVNNPTERNTCLRPRGLGRQASSTRQSSGEQSTGQDTASSARLQLTDPRKYHRIQFAYQNKTRDLQNLFGRIVDSDIVVSTRTFRTKAECEAFCNHAIVMHYTTDLCDSVIKELNHMIERVKVVRTICDKEENFSG